MRGVTMKKGSLIHTEKPFIHCLSLDLRFQRCDNCYAEKEILKCTGCQYVKYCDMNCQRSSWPEHKHECSNFKKLAEHRELPNLARILARVIMKLKRGGGNDKGFYPKDRFRVFKDLMSHYNNIKDDPKKMEHATCLYQVLVEFMGADHLPNFPEFVGLYGRVTINSFNILDLDMTNLGTGIYLGASTIDHSCDPNAVATFIGTTIQIRTIADIEDYSWSKVRICYTEMLRGRAERSGALNAQYYFSCDCRKCNPSNIQASNENVILCRECSRPVNNDKEIKSCLFCDWKVPDEIVTEYEKVQQFVKDQHKTMENVAYLDACKVCIAKMDGLFHPSNVLYVKTLDLAFESAIQLGKWGECTYLGRKVIDGYRMYYGPYSPILGYHYMKYAKILLHENRLTEAKKALDSAQEIIKVTHGSEHPLYKVELYKLMLPLTNGIVSHYK